MKDGKGYNHSSTNKGHEKCGYVEPKPIGAKVTKPTPDMPTPSMGKGMANMNKGKK